MLIVKDYKFYVVYCNEELCDKCSNLYGYCYGVRCYFEV